MNILFVFSSPIIPNAGGVQRVTSVISRELQRRGHKVVYLAYTQKELIGSCECDTTQYYVKTAQRTLNDIKIDVQAILSGHRIEFVIFQSIDISIAQCIPADVKVIAVCHGQPYSSDGITRRQIWNIVTHNIRQRLFKFATLIFPSIYERFFSNVDDRYFVNTAPFVKKMCLISERFFHRVLKHLPDFPMQKLCAINNPNSFNVDSIEPLQNRENVILWVGRIVNNPKNITDFIRMWSILGDLNPNWRAIVIGDGQDLEYCTRYVVRKHIKNIEFLGNIADVSNFYAMAKFVAITSYSESWCMVLTEAMAYGCVPCVYDTYESLYDIVDNNQNGLIISPNHKEMAACLQRYINDSHKWQEMSVAAREKVRKFAVENIVDQWENLLNSI